MAGIDGLSALTTRDLNRVIDEEEQHTIQDPQEKVVLPKYGNLWRQIIRERESKELVSQNENLNNTDPDSFQSTQPNARALNFLEAIERKETVSISAAQECQCPPPIVEFVSIGKEQTKHINMDRRKRSSDDSHDIASDGAVQNVTEGSKTVSDDEETETEVDEEDMPSVYETADEFEDDEARLRDNEASTLVEEETHGGLTEKSESRTAQNEQRKSRTEIIIIDSDSDDMEDYTSKVVNLRKGPSRNTRNIDDNNEKRGTIGFHVPKLLIATKEKDTKARRVGVISGKEQTTCLSPRLIDETLPSANCDPLVDIDDEADDEYDTESEDEEEEAEWLPDDESIRSSQKSKPRKAIIEKRNVGKRTTINQTTKAKQKLSAEKVTKEKQSEKQLINQSIDLCDSSSSDGVDSDYTESEDEEEAEWLPDDESIQSSQKSKPRKAIKRNVGKRTTINQKTKANQKLSTEKVTEERQSEKQLINQSIDLCDSSSSDGVDSDFTVSTDDDQSVEIKEQNIPVVVNKKQANKGMSKAAFKRSREQITALAFDEFNRKAFGGKLEKVVVKWSKKLNTTAGLTRLQKVSTDMTPGVPLKRLATIELSTKVVDDEEKLRTTLLHELVHAAVWIFEGVSKPPHGADFKRWAKIAMAKVPDVTVTTTHSYQIQYKFNWACVNPKCSFTIGRHSKSVDLVRHRCGRCRGKLMEVTASGAPKKRAQPSAYNLFVKQHSKAVREHLVKRKPGITQADVMKELGRLWREQKSRSASVSAGQ